jgi:hypothetical protein
MKGNVQLFWDTIDDRLDADTGEAFINAEAAIGHHNGIFWGKHQRTQAAGPAP